MKRLIWLLMLTVLFVFSLPLPVRADSNIAISGSFYRYYSNPFKMLPGESLMTPDVFVVVFNQSAAAVRIKLVTQVPPAVTIRLSQTDFEIPAKGEKKIEVGLIVDKQAVPGEYLISISADIQAVASAGIAIMGSPEQQAKLVILGEAGEAKITTLGLHDEVLPTEIHLYHRVVGQLVPAGYAKTGILQARLAPGEYFAQAFYQDTEVAKQDFSLAANEKKEFVLSARLVFVQTFAASPNYYEKDRKIAFVKISYAVKTFQPLKEVKVILAISFAGGPEKTEIISLPALDAGVFEGSYRYIPSQGWENGVYSFALQIVSEGRLRVQSSEQLLEVEMPGPGAVNWLLIGIIAGTVAALVLIILFLKRRK